MTDTISLVLPTDMRYRGVATLVLGGIGSRLDLPYERVDELQLAVLSVLDAGAGPEVSLVVAAEDATVTVSIGPLAAGSGSDQGLATVLDRLVDEVRSEEREGEEWLALQLTNVGR
jgi:anti-sigma regulatory factor (Ser/Thr protein kinase)